MHLHQLLLNIRLLPVFVPFNALCNAISLEASAAPAATAAAAATICTCCIYTPAASDTTISSRLSMSSISSADLHAAPVEKEEDGKEEEVYDVDKNGNDCECSSPAGTYLRILTGEADQWAVSVKEEEEEEEEEDDDEMEEGEGEGEGEGEEEEEEEEGGGGEEKEEEEKEKEWKIMTELVVKRKKVM
eukprot:MONOS_15551.1-p1 / transcript=MONOS_15551.1 / gene=MONOS_15551 / organism=Monocercomonoides_exilis_PA203 / gene_product=unspecified product / transcript_product=unspecified product / location=Mono_scaffold01268:13411-14071(-) / protein_length=188 / sequence_SO=supercontig / SO=protein_coding / is_pseudo=false